MDASGGCHAYDVRGEGCGRHIDQIGALGKADRPPGSPVDRDGTIWTSAADRLRRPLGVEMTRTEGRSPASDWHQGNVDLRHPVEGEARTCVPRIPALVGADNQVAECWSAMRAPWMSAAVMIGGKDAYLEAAKLHEVTRLDLTELETAGGDWLEEPARARWGDENRRGREYAERGQVCVVGM
jgi:hypothetical protein